MHSERITYLATADQKAALEAFARARGESVGNVVREATARYIAQPPENDDDRELDVLVRELEAAMPDMRATIDAMVSDVTEARKAVAAALKQSSNRK